MTERVLYHHLGSCKFVTVIEFILLLVNRSTTISNNHFALAREIGGIVGEEVSSCSVLSNIDKNYLTPIDVFVKNPDSKIACIRARFSLAIKVEAQLENQLNVVDPGKADDNSIGAKHRQVRRLSKSSSGLGKSDYSGSNEIIGYLPLEQVLSVEESCPISIKSTQQLKKKTQSIYSNGHTAQKLPSLSQDQSSSQQSILEVKLNEAKNNEQHIEDVKADRLENNLEMIVTFECGKLTFMFERNETCTYLSSIRGQVRLADQVTKEFYVSKPMLVTSDLDHHFKFDELIEINSQTKSEAYILSANMYFTEIETFRNTTNIDFIKPPDENSKPFPENPSNPANKQ